MKDIPAQAGGTAVITIQRASAALGWFRIAVCMLGFSCTSQEQATSARDPRALPAPSSPAAALEAPFAALPSGRLAPFGRVDPDPGFALVSIGSSEPDEGAIIKTITP